MFFLDGVADGQADVGCGRNGRKLRASLRAEFLRQLHVADAAQISRHSTTVCLDDASSDPSARSCFRAAWMFIMMPGRGWGPWRSWSRMGMLRALKEWDV